MKKLNNKGMTIVELVLCFAIIVIIALGMFNTVIEMKNDLYQQTINNELSDFQTNLLITIENDLIISGYKTLEDCSTTNVKCANLQFVNQSVKQLKIDLDNQTIYYDDIKYDIPNKDLLNFSNEQVVLEEQQNNLIISIPYSYKDKKNQNNLGIEIIHPIAYKYQTGQYKIITNNQNGGILVADSADYLEKVNFTVHPKEDYYYDGSAITYQNGEVITLSKEEKQFIMPSSDVTITPIFKKI